MGTTKTSGWALFLFLAGFTFIWTPTVGGGILGFLVGAALIGYSAIVFKGVRPKEEL